MEKNSGIVLTRNCDATEIPSGKPVTLFEGTEVRITQCLGGTFTVVTLQGAMVSVGGKDADALGKEIPDEAKECAEADLPLEEQVWKKLKTCFDPEIPHNIVDLGLIYKLEITPAEEGKSKVDIQMTLTAPGCGMGEWLKQDVQNKVTSVASVGEVRVEMVFDPPWTAEKMNKALRRSLNM
ncbi:MAG: putative Fe-S cluster assembly protein SufT [Candidatus Omnitrophota bacterium]|nr:putative Fe-S cluster assembly protein SufT [Candidatus Omnitrophota bacterium]